MCNPEERRALSPLSRWALRVLLAYSAVFLLQTQCAPAKPHVPPAEVVRPVEVEALADTGKGAPGQPTEKLIPPSPEPWQKTPPCDEEQDEHAISGACWQATSRRPPCGQLWRHKDLCFRAIAKAKGRPVSDSP